MTRHAGFVAASIWAFGLCGCMVGPKYKPPTPPAPPAFKEALPDGITQETWSPGSPADQTNRGRWWKIFNDPQLNDLEDQLSVNNQNLLVAEARLRQARAAIRYNRAAQFPTIGIAPGLGEERYSANTPYFNKALVNNGTGIFTFPLEFSYEADLWGRIRRSVNSAKEEAQATAGDLETARLSLHAELARDYFEVRSTDLQKGLLDQTVEAYDRAEKLTEARYHGGASPRAEVEQAKTQLASAKAQDTDIAELRGNYEHAIAVLIGKAPEEFSLAAQMQYELRTPDVPIGVATTLLQRRPDVASAERRVAQANNQIGIAKSAYYPTVTIGASAGFEGTSVKNWFTWPSRLWAVGPNISETIFDGGRRRAVSESATANYDATVSIYRQNCLTAFQEVEDSLNALGVLQREAVQQDEATEAAERARDLFLKRYKDGVDTYLQVVTSQTTALQNERNGIDIRRRQIEASVLLVKAVGGGWDQTQLPNF
jgi:NodT family efflux transporter outer membrane factor (OMF) lipoprotein